MREISVLKSGAHVSHRHNVQQTAKHTPAFHLSEVRDYKSAVICELNYYGSSISHNRILQSIHPTLHQSQH